MSAARALAGAAFLSALAPLTLAQTPAEKAPPELAPTPCLQNGDKIEGEFRWVDTRHVGTHGRIHAPFLVLAAPRCARDENGQAQGRWVQLSLERGSALSKLKLGDVIVVRAAYKSPHNAGQIGDIFADEALILDEHAP